MGWLDRDASHDLIVHLEAPEQCAAVIASWLQKLLHRGQTPM